MAGKKANRIQYKRKRQGKTNYRKRFKLLLAEKPRLVVRKTIRNTIIQVVKFKQKGDVVAVTVQTSYLRKLGWAFNTGSVPAAYLAGYIAGKRSLASGIKDAILDTGMQNKGPRIYAALKGALDAGLNIPHNEKIIPGDDMITGEAIKKYAELLSKDKERYDKLFSGYSKNNLDVSAMPKLVEKIKEQIGKK